MRNVLVTGGCGFIGSHFLKLINGRYNIINIDKLTYAGNVKNIEDIDCKNYYIDIADKKVEDIIRENRIDTILNFAAQSIAENCYLPIKTTYDTRILTFGQLWEQQRLTKSVIEKNGNEYIFFNNKNVKALSFYNKGRWMPIKSIVRHWYEGKIVNLEQKWGSISATPNHSIYSANLELVSPIDNPEVLVVRSINENKKVYKDVDSKLLSVLASYITEGSAFKNKANGSYIVSISQKDYEWLKEKGEYIKLLFNIENYNIKSKKDGTFELIICNKYLYNYLRSNCGVHSCNKKFPNWIFDMSLNKKLEFFSFLQEGDGCTKSYGKGRHNDYITTSEYLAHQISLLLTLIGKNFTIEHSKFENEKWNNKYVIKVKDSFHIGQCKKKIDIIEYKGWVYDLEIEKTHNFVCGLGNVVCHNTHVDRSIKNPTEFLETDIIGLFNLIDSAMKCEVKRIVHISTDEVYGDAYTNLANETFSLKPNSPYAASKASADLLLRSYFKTYKLPIIIIRPCNNYGPNQYPEKLVPLSIMRLLNNERVLLHGEGKEIREWIYVDDCVRAIEQVMLRGHIGGIYNLGSGDRFTNLVILFKIISTLKEGDKFSDWIKKVPNRPGNDKRYALDSQKIKRLIGDYTDTYMLKGMTQTIKWYIEHRDWWKDVDTSYNIHTEEKYKR